jgi:ABC-type branched-subunit amino acid transport system substrate-binding protein
MVLIFAFSGCGDGKAPEAEDPDPSAASGPKTDGWQETDKQSLVFGGVRSKTGANAIFEQTSFGPQYKMWVDELNQDGGIYIPSIGKKLPVELKIYDDKSDVPTMVRLYEQLCLEEKVDILLPPSTNLHLFAAAPIAHKYGYLLIAGEGGGLDFEKLIPQNPNVFAVLNRSQTQVPAIVDLFREKGITSVFCA